MNMHFFEQTPVVNVVFHKPWAALHVNWKLESEHCTCMAGLVSCSVVAAVLFKIQAAVSRQNKKTCTDEAAQNVDWRTEEDHTSTLHWLKGWQNLYSCQIFVCNFNLPMHLSGFAHCIFL